MKLKYTTLLLVLSLLNSLYAWENKKTHPAITSKATEASVIDDYLKTQMRLTDGTSTQLYWNFPQDIKTRIGRGKAEPDKTTRNISEWLRVGSIIEDEDGRLIVPWRPRHHFHDPIRNAGLDNHTDHPDWDAPGWSSWLPLGESALVWATDGFAEQEPTTNCQSWQDTRADFYAALTHPIKTNREEFLAITFLDLGCVLHMIEDVGVPAHARNDFLYGHYRSVYTLDWGNPLEGWVEKQVKANDGQSPWSGSGPVVFDKLAKYFDADTYAGDYLGDGQWPPKYLWGLAECTNYQFQSLSTVFGCSGVKYQFPHPAKEHTSELIEGRKVYFDGSNYGVVHLARDSYTYYKATRWGYISPVTDSTNTTDDEKVFIDYANITIPRTIDYATGLANYFFRGRLNVEPNYPDPNIVELIITNNSNNSGVPQTLKAGTFEIYWDDTSDTRTQINPAYITFIPEWTPASTLPNDGGLTELIARFAPPAEVVKKYVVVYRGNIRENPADPDPHDLNAIAVGITCSDDCPHAFPECETPKYVYARFSMIEKCPDQPPDFYLTPPNDRVFKLTQSSVNPCEWIYYVEPWFIRFSAVSNPLQTYILLESTDPWATCFYDLIAGAPDEGYVYHNDFAACGPGVGAAGGIATVTWGLETLKMFAEHWLSTP